MSGHQTATVDDTVYFWFASNDTSGSGGDGATPLFDVREAGAAAGAIPLLSGTPTLLSHANYPSGCYEVAIAATTGNGFAADDTFAVFCTLAIDAQNPSGFVGSCTLTPLAKEATAAGIQNDLDNATDGLGALKILIDAVDTVVDALAITIGTNGNNLTALGGMTTAMKNQVNAEVDTALLDIGLDHLLSTALPTSWAADVNSTSALGQMGGATFATGTDSLEAISNDLSNGTDGLGELKTAIDAVQSDLDNGADGLGALKILIDAVKAETVLILADTDELQLDDVPTLIGNLNDAPAVSAATIASAVADETLTSHVTADSLAVHLKDTLADTNELQVDDIPTTLATIAGYIDTEVQAIKDKTDSLNFDVGGVVNANTKYINSAALIGDGNTTPWDGA